jgi:hypothetical protein
VFTAESAPEVSEPLGVSVSAGDPLTDALVAKLRGALGVPAAMNNDQFKEALQAQGFVKRTSAPPQASASSLIAAAAADDDDGYGV